MTATIFFIQTPLKQQFDLSSAERLGRIEFILDTFDKPSHCPGPCIKKLRDKLKNYKKGDKIAWAGGDIAGVLYAGLVLGELALTEIEILKWEREVLAGERTGSGYYTPVPIKLRRSNMPLKDHTIFTD